MGQRLQLPISKRESQLHKKYGYPEIEIVRGAGKISRPKLMLLFMNPTARNLSSTPGWHGLRAPWIGTQAVWDLLIGLGLIDKSYVPKDWTESSALRLYEHITDRDLYIGNLASCTQPDARALPNAVFKAYLPVIHDEITALQPRAIVTFGNQISSVLLQKPISVSDYPSLEKEILSIGNERFEAYPTYYPVGQGRRNLPKTVYRIGLICDRLRQKHP